MNKFFKIVVAYFVGLILLYQVAQYFINKGARFNVGDCFTSKEFPIRLRIKDIKNGSYVIDAIIIFIPITKEETIEEFDNHISKGFDLISCDTGEKI